MFRSLTRLLCLCCLLSVLVPATAADAEAPVIRVGIVRYTMPAVNQPIVEATLAAIRSRLAGYRVAEERLSRDELEEAVKKGRVDVFLSSAGFYRRLVPFGARDLATAVSAAYPDPNHSDGTAIIVRNEDADLRSFADLKGLRLAVNNRHGFSGYQIPMGEIIGRGFPGASFFSQILEVGDADKVPLVLAALKNRQADAAFLKQCILEHYIRNHPQDARLFRVLEPKQNAGQCARSTGLYPTWTLGSTAATDPEVSRRITSAVLSMPPAADGLHWGVATDYSAVDQLLQNLKIGPYEHLRQWTIRRFLNQYWPFLALVVLMIAGLIAHSLRVSAIVKERTAELRAALAQKEMLRLTASEAQQRLTNLQKIGVINQISSIVAHELRQPLGAITLYLAGLKTMVENDSTDKERFLKIIHAVTDQAERADAIVERVRAYRKNSAGLSGSVSLSSVVTQAVSNFRQSLVKSTVDLRFTVQPGITVRGDPLELELLVVNLTKNAVEAVGLEEDGFVHVDLKREGNTVKLTVTDNGPVRTDADVEAIRHRMNTTKENGMGLGLQIVSSIAERHQATLTFDRRPPCGLIVTVTFPVTAS